MLDIAHRRFALLVCGVAGPLLLLVVLLVDGATRSGYSPWRNGVSQLVLGDRGWLARLTFVVCGLLLFAFSVGVARTIRSGPGATWGSRLLGAVAGGLVIAGVFPTDPALGYPPGAAERASVAGGVHQVGGTLLFVGLIGAGIVFGRRFARESDRAWAVYSITTGALVAGSALAAGIVYRLIQKEILSAGPAGLLELVSFLLGFTWITLLAVCLIRRTGDPANPT